MMSLNDDLWDLTKPELLVKCADLRAENARLEIRSNWLAVTCGLTFFALVHTIGALL